MNRVVALTAQIALACLAWIADYYYPNEHLDKAFLTFIALAVIYFIFRIILEQAIGRTVKEAKTRYSIRKATSILYVMVFLLVVIIVWVEDSQALLVSFGLVGAGIAIGLQDIFKNFVGGIVVFTTGMYRVGDRVEMDSNYGDVIDVGLMYTSLLEIGEWVGGDQATGRITVVPNGRVISGTVNNYTKDHEFVWDEISLPITYDSDWKSAVERFRSIVERETEKNVVQAQKDLSKIMNRYYVSERVVDPVAYVSLTGDHIDVRIRYIALARARRATKDRLFRLLLDELRDTNDIRIAPGTMPKDAA